MSWLGTSQAQSTAHYITAFLDLVEEVPNEVQRHLSQLHHLNSAYLRIVDRTESVVHKYKLVVQALAAANGFCSDRDGLTRSQLLLSKKLETQLIQIQELSDEKLRYSQMIFDLIDTKAKELDLDYEEVIRFSGKMLDTKNNTVTNGSDKSLATNLNNGIASVTKVETSDKKKEETDDNSRADKRWLPRRACAVRNGQISEAVDNAVDRANGQSVENRPTSGRVVAKKSIKGKNFTKSHSFGLSMSTFYRQIAKRRAKQKLPQKSNKISAKSSRHSAQTKTKRNDNPSKDRGSDGKAANSCHSVEPVVRKKSAITSRRRSSSDSSTDNESFKGSNSCDNRNSNRKSHKSGHSAGRSASKRQTSGRKAAESSSTSSSEYFVGEPIDPNEPVYCLCAQVSFGQMICCDNSSCAIEWFHFPCVQLEVKPKGKWYCPHCRKAPRIHNVGKGAKHRN